MYVYQKAHMWLDVVPDITNANGPSSKKFKCQILYAINHISAYIPPSVQSQE